MTQSLQQPLRIAGDARRWNIDPGLERQRFRQCQRLPGVEAALHELDEIERRHRELDPGPGDFGCVMELVEETRLPSEVAFDRFDGFRGLVRLRRERKNVEPHAAGVQRRAQLVVQPRQERDPSGRQHEAGVLVADALKVSSASI